MTTPAAPSEDREDLKTAVRKEREYVKERLAQELQREPTEKEIDEWINQHTEGY
jgi:DNA-directed RNA polymerase specialized sigma subunit